MNLYKVPIKKCLYCGFRGETDAKFCTVLIEDLDSEFTETCGQRLVNDNDES